MQDILFHYTPVNPITWAYLSSLLTIGLFFKFGRLWSLRNLDLMLLIALAPGLILASGVATEDPVVQYRGYLCLFVVGGLLLVRTLLDPVMVRRPLLEPNLSVGGMTFIGVSLLAFLTANVLTSPPDAVSVAATRGPSELYDSAKVPPKEEKPSEPTDKPAAKDATQELAAPSDRLGRYGPGFPILLEVAHRVFRPAEDPFTVRLIAIFAHVAVVVGVVVIGYRHFDNYKTGIAVALLYLMLPYTAQKTGELYHFLPAALLVWVIVAYRRPLASGLLMGLAIGTTYYPVFLLPLWASFYWRRGLFRFAGGVALSLIVLVAWLAIDVMRAGTFTDLPDMLRQMFGWTLPKLEHLKGFWQREFVAPEYRIPIVAAFVVMSISFAMWPVQKNLGTLLSCSAAVLIGVQFWHAHGGGLYAGWYLPCLLLTIFRPNLEDRVALAVLPSAWRPKWIQRIRTQTQAA